MENLTLEEFLGRINKEYRWWAERAAKNQDVIGLYAKRTDEFDFVSVDVVSEGDQTPWDEPAQYKVAGTVAYWRKGTLLPLDQQRPDVTLPRIYWDTLYEHLSVEGREELMAADTDDDVAGVLVYAPVSCVCWHCLPVSQLRWVELVRTGDWYGETLSWSGMRVHPRAYWKKE